jgi:uncharacterized protein YukE
VSDAPLGALAGALESLVDQLVKVNSDLARAVDTMAWSGAAADAFHTTAGHRATEINGLMHQVQDAADAAKAASDMIF